MNDQVAADDMAALESMFEQSSNSINPAEFPKELFLHYSLPAFDELGGPVLNRGEEIESNKTLLQQDAILVSKLNPRKPRVQIVRKSAVPLRQVSSTEFISLVAVDDKTDLKYFKHLLSSTQVQRKLDSLATGTTNSHVRARPHDLLRQRVFTPPIFEQRRIAEILDTLDNQIHVTEQIIEKLRIAAAGFSDDSFSGLLDSDLLMLPLGSLLVHLIDYRGRTPKKIGMDWGGGDILALSANNVQMGGINPAKEAYFGSDALFARWMTNGMLKRGDILMTLEAPLGNIAQVPDDSKYILSQRVVLMRFDEARFMNHFAYWYLQSRIFQQELIRNSTGTTASGIRRASLEKIHLPLVEIAAQERISSVLFAFESKIAAERRGLAKLRLQKGGLMSDLLTGRVRVPMGTAS